MTGTSPSAAELIERAAAMIEPLRQRSSDADKNGRLAPQTVQGLRQAGFFRILQPERFGGYGMRPSVLWQVTRELGRGCGSTAFIVSLLGVHSWLAGMFESKAQEEVFQGGGDTVLSNVSIGVRRRDEVAVTDGGYVVSGSWSYASGIDLADWVIAAVRVPVGNGVLEERIALIEADSFSIVPETWNVLGARGTGSKNVTLDRVFVPRHRTVSWADVQNGTYPGASINAGPLYRLSAGSLLVLSSAAPVVATACAVVDRFIEKVRGRDKAADRWFQVELGASASQIHMAHALLLHDADETYDWAKAGRELTVEIQGRHRADAVMISRVALEGAHKLLLALGGGILPAGDPAERALRDLYAMASHMRVQPEHGCGLYGQILLGIEGR
jgi:alkylation response protein AidB-like acyl-CoA dehydrogenase